jgi:GDPmannose 4,6-dehydratase
MKAFITGITGQDGSLLAHFLIKNGYSVTGGYRRGLGKLWRLQQLDILDQITLVDYEIGNSEDLAFYLRKAQFSEIYHLAGISRTSDSFHHPRSTVNTNLNGVIEILEAARLSQLESKIFIAGSSEIFGSSQGENIKDESSIIRPSNPYGVAHSASKFLSDIYREVHSLAIYYGILFNHESFLRDSIFITKKLAQEFGQIANGDREFIEIGNFNTSRDWGLATEFVQAMHSVMQFGKPGAYVFGTGKLHSLKELISAIGSLYGFEVEFIQSKGEWKAIDVGTGRILVKTHSRYLRPFDTPGIAGNPKLLEESTGHRFTSDIQLIAKSLVDIKFLHGYE